MLNKYILFMLMVVLLPMGCDQEHSHEHNGLSHDESEHNHESQSQPTHHGDEDDHHAENEVHLTIAQKEAIGLQIGSFQTIKIGGFVKANGVLDLPPEEFASISSPREGFVNAIKGNFLVGSYVKKGIILAVLEHPAYISLQQEYLELLAQLEFQEKEVERQRQLSESNAGILKKFEEAQSQLKVMQAQQAGFRQQLIYIGISPEMVQKGEIRSTINLRAPISGYISKLNIHKGQYVRPEDELYEIINTNHIHLELDIFEKDIAKIKQGQMISFTIPSLGGEIYKGKVRLIGKSFNMENKTVRIHGHIEGKHPEFIRGLYLDAKIWINDHIVKALPQEAIHSENNLNFIFVRKPHDASEVYAFDKVRVKTGVSDGKLVEVTPIEPLLIDAEIVISEVYYLAAEMIKSELEHSH